MFKIITSKRYEELLKAEQERWRLAGQIQQAHRWLGEYTHMDPLWEWFRGQKNCLIDTLRDEIRALYREDLKRKGYVV